MIWSRRNAKSVRTRRRLSPVQKLWRQISAVWPGKSAVLRHLERSEELEISERLEHRTPQLVRKIDVTLRSVGEPKPDRVVLHVTRISDRVVHSYSMMIPKNRLRIGMRES